MIEDFSKNKPSEIRELLLLLFNACKATSKFTGNIFWKKYSNQTFNKLLAGESPCDTAGKIYTCVRDTSAKV